MKIVSKFLASKKVTVVLLAIVIYIAASLLGSDLDLNQLIDLLT